MFIAIQIAIETFEQIKQILEDHALFNLMREDSDAELLEFNDAQKYYNQLVKKA